LGRDARKLRFLLGREMHFHTIQTKDGAVRVKGGWSRLEWVA
jgi:hypothetical protein